MKQTEEKTIKDNWTDDGSIFVCDGLKYGIAPGGETVCQGPAEKAPEKPPDGKKSVTKLSTKGNGQGKTLQAQEKGIMLHKKKGGRPRKPAGEVITRQTKWRRQKELQGQLL